MTDDMMRPAGAATARPFGQRRDSAGARAAERLADGFDGLPPGGSRWRLAAALRAAARRLDIGASMLALLEHYIDLTYDVDWTPGCEPVVIRPLIEIAEHFGRSERQIRNLEAGLAERGLLTWRDSGNHHRKGRRGRDGRLLYAYGPSLAPLGARYGEILAAATAGRDEIAGLRRLRLAIAALRRRLRALLEASPACETTAAVRAAAAALPERLPAGTTPQSLERVRAALAAMAARLEGRESDAGVEAVTKAETTGQEEIRGRHIPEDHRKNSMNGYASRTPQAKRTGQQAMEKSIDAGQALRAGGAMLRDALADRERVGWRDIVDAASRIAPGYGVSAELWGWACARLGRERAALCMALLDRAGSAPGDGGGIASPQAYFRALLSRAERGELSLGSALRESAEGARSGWRRRARSSVAERAESPAPW